MAVGRTGISALRNEESGGDGENGGAGLQAKSCTTGIVVRGRGGGERLRRSQFLPAYITLILGGATSHAALIQAVVDLTEQTGGHRDKLTRPGKADFEGGDCMTTSRPSER